MPLSLSNAADADVRNIYFFGADRFGVVVADKYAAKLNRALLLIADNPRIARLREEMVGDLRAYPFGSHIIIYKIMGEDVLVVRVRHAAEDWQGDPM